MLSLLSWGSEPLEEVRGASMPRKGEEWVGGGWGEEGKTRRTRGDTSVGPDVSRHVCNVCQLSAARGAVNDLQCSSEGPASRPPLAPSALAPAVAASFPTLSVRGAKGNGVASAGAGSGSAILLLVNPPWKARSQDRGLKSPFFAEFAPSCNLLLAPILLSRSHAPSFLALNHGVCTLIRTGDIGGDANKLAPPVCTVRDAVSCHKGNALCVGGSQRGLSSPGEACGVNSIGCCRGS
jgi:hypothetical protein